MFLFTLIDAAKPDREFSFVVDVSDGSYRMPLCDPPIATAELMAKLNEDRNLNAFIRRSELAAELIYAKLTPVRAAFVAHISR